jgi:hypothetical protein
MQNSKYKREIRRELDFFFVYDIMVAVWSYGNFRTEIAELLY